MSDLYNRIYSLCRSKGISIGKMCAELGISRGNLTELKMERIKTLKAENLNKISGFFGVTVDCLLNGLEKTPAPEGERKPSDDDIKFALFGGSEEITDAMYNEVKSFAAYVENREKGNK